jgi:hypothetical protein
VRLLANIETETEKLLPLVLAGQPELADRLNDPTLRQLKQRIALRCEITPFDLQETAAYIATRVRTAGGEASRLFTREAVTLIHDYSRGIPRTISVMCDNALVSGMALGRQPVDRAIVLEVSNDFDLHRDQQDLEEPAFIEPRVEPAKPEPESVAPIPPTDEARTMFGVQPRRYPWRGLGGRAEP